MNPVHPSPTLPVTVRWPLAAGALWVLLLVVAEFVGRRLAEMPTLCVFRRATGVPCPTCGATRAVRAAFTGQIWEAIAFNPGLALLVGFVMTGIALRLAGRPWPRPRHAGTQRIGAVIVIVVFAANWVYVIWRDLQPTGA